VVSGGRAGCQETFEGLTALSYTDLRRGAAHQLLVDAYSMQHPEEYGRSAKSYAAHLMRLCCGVELNGDPGIYAAIPRWLNGRVDIEKPELVNARGKLTVLHAAAAPVEEYAACIRAWAKDVWDAYSTQHVLARRWLDAARDRSRHQ
jgi:hypothetical protein